MPTSSTLGSPVEEADTPSQDDPQPSTSTVVTPQSTTGDIILVPGLSKASRKKAVQQEQLADKLRQAADQQNQLLLLTKEFVQRTQGGDPVRRSYSQYVISVMLKLPSDLYRRVSRQI